MFKRAMTVGTIRGIDLRVDPTLLLFAALVVMSFWQRFAFDGYAQIGAGSMAVVAALLFFGSVLAHELAHALEAQHRGIEVAGITLFLFGGVTEMHLEAERPRDEFALAAVGPYSSLVLAAGFGVIAGYAGSAGTSLRGVADVAGLLGWFNVGLAVFNLLPGAPLDGGRVLRSGLWALTGDRDVAARLAARSGQILASLLIAAGVYVATSTGGGLLSGIWFAVIGTFLLRAASAEVLQARVNRVVRDRTIGSLVTDPPPPVAPGEALALVEPRLVGHEVVPVRSDGNTVGALVTGDVTAMDAQDRTFRLVEDVMRPVDDAPLVPAATPLIDVLRRSDEPELLRIERDGDEILMTRDALVATLRSLRARRRDA